MRRRAIRLQRPFETTPRSCKKQVCLRCPIVDECIGRGEGGEGQMTRGPRNHGLGKRRRVTSRGAQTAYKRYSRGNPGKVLEMKGDTSTWLL